MKVFAALASLALASNCSEKATEKEQAKCYMEEFPAILSKFGGPPLDGTCVKSFLERCLYCVENVQLGSPFCVETNPNYNPIMCAVHLNICLYQQLDGLFDDVCMPDL